MKYPKLHSLIAMAVLTIATLSHAADTATNFEFAESTPLSSGKWVKISIGETGLYEITYDELRAMGFSNPSNVALFGTGGGILNYNFIDASDKALYSDVLHPTAVLHTGEKMIFYGCGTETMNVSTTGYSKNKRFKHNRLTKNIYSDRSYYLLTDSSTPLRPTQHHVENKANCTEFNQGYAYIYHEKDSRHNNRMEGQVFWGEEAYINKPVSYEVEARYCVDAPAYLWLAYALPDEVNGTMESSLNGHTSTASLINMAPNVYNLGNSLDASRLIIDDKHRGRGTVRFNVTGDFAAAKPIGIDYWTLSYPINLGYAKEDPEFTCQYIAFLEPSSMRWKHPVPDNCVAWDITGRNQPIELDIEGGYLYNDVHYITQLVVFNPDREQLHIDPEWKEIPNQNLHALQEEPISMVIFTTPALKEYAERIARLHEDSGDSKVIVLTTEEIYNEFNHGTPDVTALRAFVKMIYHKQRDTLKNVLLFGNIQSDYRHVDTHKNAPEGLPVYMVPKINLKGAEGAEGCASIDYLGMMADYLNATGILGNASMEIGVGILPVTTKEEAETVVNKIGDYLSKEDFSNLVNEFMTISGEGDSHIHDFQSFRLTNMYRTYSSDLFDSEYAVSPLWTEDMGSEKVRDELLASMKRGKLMTTYYGHAGGPSFGSVTPQDLMNVRNNEPSFFFFAACDLCEPDRMHHGIGDLSVIRTRQGFIGTIGATRAVLSHENQAFSENFVTSIFYDSERQQRTATPTIGEIYADSKTRTTNISKQAYMLIGDPALPFPAALGKIELHTDRAEYLGGEIMEVSGKVLGNTGQCDNGFNGYVTVKLMEPATETAIVPDPVNDKGEIKPNPRLKINDYRIAAGKATVKNGEFKVRLALPERVNSFLSTPDSIRHLTLLAGAYDPATRKGHSGRLSVEMPQIGTEKSEDAKRDTQVPAISISFDPLFNKISTTVSDETGVFPGIGIGKGIIMTVDGTSVEAPGDYPSEVTVGSYTGSISASGLKSGTHKAIAMGIDAAGNKSAKKELIFEIKESEPLRLTADTEAVTDELRVRISSDPGCELTLLICDREGRILHSDTFSGVSTSADMTGLRAGTYRAAVRAESAAGAKVYSNWLTFSKID
ncbi:MAG: hypothetical protein K2G67_05440 [Muribaculaceae bacterium]|nr:hypothetical protein [Muribaculaceae bacterium]